MRNYTVTLAKRSCTMAMKSRNAGFISPFFHAISKAMEGTFPAMGRNTTAGIKIIHITGYQSDAQPHPHQIHGHQNIRCHRTIFGWLFSCANHALTIGASEPEYAGSVLTKFTPSSCAAVISFHVLKGDQPVTPPLMVRQKLQIINLRAINRMAH